MVWLWILLGILLILLALGLAGFEAACVRRELPPQALTEEYLRGTSRAKWAEDFVFSSDWFYTQKPQTLRVMSYDGKMLSARFLPREDAKGTILLFHGYRSSGLLDFGPELEFLHRQGYNLLLCDQRAHGASQGRYMTFGVRERYDVLSWVTYLAQMLGAEHPMFLSGMSMGATTVLLASCFTFPANVRGVIADCGFSSPYAIMKCVLNERCKWLLAGLVLHPTDLFTRVFAGFSLHECATTDAVAATSLPVLFLHGSADHFVPCRMSQEAYDACAGERKLLLISGAGHARAYLTDPPRVQSAMEDFLENHLPKEDVV